jgi:formate hydrogenlyase transcriptional activator
MIFLCGEYTMFLKTLDPSENAPSFNESPWIGGQKRVMTMNRTEDDESEYGRHGIIGGSAAIWNVLAQVDVVAPTDSTVLIQGETGTGKELFAQAIHRLSRRHAAPLVTLNCAAIPAGLLESELFGHERGAFTGAVTQRIGRFEMANGGTLFLDEIGDMALDLQVKLLRVLQEQTFERLGGTRTSRVNVRVVAATNRDLARMVDNKEFRADLFYRLSVFPIALPPLRERRGDIPELVRYFVARCAERMNKVIDEVPSETMEAIAAYHWPGNIRQLQNFIEHGVIVSPGRVFKPVLTGLQSPASAAPAKPSRTLEDATRDHIVETLKDANWVVGGRHGAAARLGLARTTLIAKMRRLGIEGALNDNRARAGAQEAFASAG